MMMLSYGEMIPAKRRRIGKSARCKSILNIEQERERQSAIACYRR
jgi:hypothetical protein